MFGSDVDDASTQCFEIKPRSKRMGFFYCVMYLLYNEISNHRITTRKGNI